MKRGAEAGKIHPEMGLRIYNTYIRRKKEFRPLEEGRVKMYVCGITAYDLCHVGHARAILVFDMIYRYLRHLGYRVDYVRNFTDVDDKIIRRANELGIPPGEVAERYIEEFYRDMDPLGIDRPTYEPRATHHVSEIISAIRTLIDKGYAYQVGGDVYYSVSKWPEYGRLSGKSQETLEAGARVDIDERKADPLDFALWKKSKPGEPSWGSPWGEGRPGWHIECSAMSQKYLGPSLDIHGGGQDLIFPHHENEIAQSEAITGKKFVQFWVHNGFVQLGREKMSKSTGIFYAVRDLYKKYHPEVLRLFLLSHHYRGPIEFSLEQLEESKKNIDYFYIFLARLGERLAVEDAIVSSRAEEEAGPKIDALATQFKEAMDDDFNTALALAHFYEFARGFNRFLDKTASYPPGAMAPIIRRVREEFLRLGGVLGLFQMSPELWFTLPLKGVDKGWIEARIRERDEARKRKDWKRADAIRNELKGMGVILEDTPTGTKWRGAI